MSEDYEKACAAAETQTTYIVDNYAAQSLGDLDDWLRQELGELDGHISDAEDGAGKVIEERDKAIEELEERVTELEREVTELEAEDG